MMLCSDLLTSSGGWGAQGARITDSTSGTANFVRGNLPTSAQPDIDFRDGRKGSPLLRAPRLGNVSADVGRRGGKISLIYWGGKPVTSLRPAPLRGPFALSRHRQ